MGANERTGVVFRAGREIWRPGRQRSAVTAFALYEILRKGLQRRRWQLDAREFPSISLEMDTDRTGAFGLAKTDPEFDRLDQSYSHQRFEYLRRIDLSEARHVGDGDAARVDRTLAQDGRKIFRGEHLG